MPVLASPVAVVKRSDGYLWLTEQMGNQVVRVTTTGDTKSYVIPTSMAFPGQITVGPDGDLWFAESIGNKIGRLAP